MNEGKDRDLVDGGNAALVRVFVFVDALGWKQVEKYGFLTDLLPNRRGIEMQFGYSCTAIPTILTGLRPFEHGHLAFYDWAPERSPFSAMKYISRLFWPKWAAANERLSGILLAASILAFIVAWGLRYAAKKRREKEWLDHVLATAPVLDYGQIAFHGETD